MGLIKSVFNTGRNLANLPFDAVKDVATFGEDERASKRLREIKRNLLDFEI